MSERIIEDYRRHKLLSAFDRGQYKGRVWMEKNQLAEIEGKPHFMEEIWR